MAVQLVLSRPVPTPAAQVRVIWQGHREGDLVRATWTDPSGAVSDWPGSQGIRWAQRDSLRQGEEWKINLPGVPDGIDRIVLTTTATGPRSVGVVVLPLTHNPDDAVQHPGAELAANETRELLELTRSGTGWLVTALNRVVLDGVEHRVASRPTISAPEQSPAPAPTVEPVVAGWSGPVTDHPIDVRRPRVRPSDGIEPGSAATAATAMRSGSSYPSRTAESAGPPVPIPPRLEEAVDAVRATGSTRSRTRVGAIVDLSASMRPWIASGHLADVLTAIQAVAGASNRPNVATRFLPADQEVDLSLATEPADALGTQLAASGLRTGDRSALVAAADLAGRRGGLTVLVTDDASLATGPGATVVLGPGASGATGRGPVVSVPAGPVDVRRLARQLADATAAS